MNDPKVLRVFATISPFFRRKRMAKFTEWLDKKTHEEILDIGGVPGTWIENSPTWQQIDVLNIRPARWTSQEYSNLKLVPISGNACDLGHCNDHQYDVVFSNSVIEHVVTWENQKKFAEEARRVGKRLWIQTPAQEFFIEPHYIAPFVHWLPKGLRRKVVRWVSLWGWLARPSKADIDEYIDEIRLLTHKEMLELFPDCEILKEKFLGIFTKSYIAVRN